MSAVLSRSRPWGRRAGCWLPEGDAFRSFELVGLLARRLRRGPGCRRTCHRLRRSRPGHRLRRAGTAAGFGAAGAGVWASAALGAAVAAAFGAAGAAFGTSARVPRAWARPPWQPWVLQRQELRQPWVLQRQGLRSLRCFGDRSFAAGAFGASAAGASAALGASAAGASAAGCFSCSCGSLGCFNRSRGFHGGFRSGRCLRRNLEAFRQKVGERLRQRCLIVT